jgi:hypothetical protein
MSKRFAGRILVCLALWPASTAAAAPATLYGRVLHLYQARGSIPPCRFSSPELASVLSSVDTYGQQYYADFIAAIQTAINARASGACSGSRHLVSPAAGGVSAGPRLPSSVTAPTSSDAPAPLIALGIAAALLAGAAGLGALARSRFVPSDWSHGWAETRYRLGGAWAVLTGRLRR